MKKHNLLTINGILLLDKPLGMTSNGALQRIKKLFTAKKAGHTGSLDPLATGMLPICFGEATKLSQYLLDADKYYEVEATLGIKTTTGDAEGEILETRPVPSLTLEQMQSVIAQFQGEIWQIPPMFSALKINGKPLYELARKGIEVERQPRKVSIHNLEIKELLPTKFILSVHCSKGTYVRTLVEDIGEKLGCFAHVSNLKRVAVSPYQDKPMFTLQELEEVQGSFGLSKLQSYLIPIESSVMHLPSVQLSPASVFYLKTGQPIRVPYSPTEGFVRIFAEAGTFLGIGEVLDDGRIAPKKLLNLS